MNASDIKRKSKRTGDEKIGSDNLSVLDVTCPICLSVMIEPVKMPCTHSLCLSCFEMNVSESKLACPVCRKRISIWVRQVRKTKNLVDKVLWNFIQVNFKDEVAARLRGDDHNNSFTSTLPPRTVCSPGEIKEEFECQLQNLRADEERKRIEEEEASKLFIATIQQEETRRLEELRNERMKLFEKDSHFAKQLREMQMQKSKNNLVKDGQKHSQSSNSNNNKDLASPVGPMDFYLGKNSQNKSNKRSLSEAGSSSQEKIRFSGLVDSNLKSSSNSNSFQSRFLKDITSQYSSETETEFDSEDNIKKSHNEKYSQGRKSHTNVSYPQATSLYSKSLPNSVIDDALSELYFTDIFNENIVDKVLFEKVVAEQKALEDRFKQEQRDRSLALRLQKSLKVDRTKGSEDEYCLRMNSSAAKRKESFTDAVPPTAKNTKFRQTTLLETLSKKQRRV